MKKGVRIFWIVFFSGALAAVLLVLLTMWGVFGKMPSLAQLENPTIIQASEVYAADGTLMGRYYSEKGNRSTVKYSEISKHVIDALVATEDERFYDHSGIDWKRTFGVLMKLGSDGGGSTITQQLALNLFNVRAKNKLERAMDKLKEYIIAVRLERNFTKEEITALYLNAVPFGDNVYGIRNASKTFFGKEPADLKVEEAAVLVGMLKGNSIYNPRKNPERATNRRNTVLDQMVKNNYLAEAEATRLKTKPIALNYKKADENTGFAPYFREVLRGEVRQLLKDIKKPNGEDYDIYDDGLKIYTTINPKMQEYAEEAVAQQLPILQKVLNSQSNIRSGSVWKNNLNVLEAAMRSSDRWADGKAAELSDDEIKKSFDVKVKMKVFAWNAKREKDTTMSPMDSIKYHRQMLQSAFMVMDPLSGEIKAWVGGINFKTYKFDHAQLSTKRQVGSTIKPLLYCQAIEERGLTPESIVVDQQQSFGSGQLVPATGRTCTGRSMTMASALAWSRNCATAYIMKQVGPSQFSNFLERINIPTHVEAFPSIALGSCDLSLYEMLWGYTIFPGHGFSTKPAFISRIEDRNGNAILRFDNNKNRKEVVSEATAYQMCKMMEGPVTIGTAKGTMQALGAKEMGGKTGTTNANSDFWFMGYSPQLLAGGWVGCDDRFISIQSGAFFGGTTVKPIWQAFFKKVYADKSLGIDRNAEFIKPASMENEINNADLWRIMQSEKTADMEDEDVNADDYSIDTTHSYIPPESQTPVDEHAPKAVMPKKEVPKKDSVAKGNKENAVDEKKKKGGFLKKIFGRREENKPQNDY